VNHERLPKGQLKVQNQQLHVETSEGKNECWYMWVERNSLGNSSRATRVDTRGTECIMGKSSRREHAIWYKHTRQGSVVLDVHKHK